mmetsp:Transcript_30602/g.65954  ORF Transcript_30602/g.65954 Transcript_30602/m.65954 type:complete len:154 (+) Transcript_30602:189-650(+)
MTNISICFILIALLFVQISVAYAFAGPRLSGLSRDRHTLWMGALNEPPLELCEENAEIVIEEVRQELGTIFGYDQGSRDVGITGEIFYVDVEGPTVSVALKGRFWHATDTVMMRVENFVRTRIPEVVEVTLDREKSDIKDDNNLNTDGGKKLF